MAARQNTSLSAEYDYCGPIRVTSPGNSVSAFRRDYTCCKRQGANLQTIDICFPASRMVERNQVWAASVFILGCHDIRYLNLASTGGALSVFIALFDASSSAMRRGTVATRLVPAKLRIAVV
jgi:hypothetical protein